MIKFSATHPRIWLVIGATLIGLSLSGCDSSEAAATVTARAVGTNTINLTLSVVPSATVGPILPATTLAIAPSAPSSTVLTALPTAAPTIAATMAPTAAPATASGTASVLAASTSSGPVATVPPTVAATQAELSSATGANTAWFSDTVLYSVFVRSFRDSNGDGIGDLQGVIDGLDYIQSLGANTIWLLPVFKSPSYHGYDTADYYTVNPDYGTNADLIRLIQTAHKRHMRILLDYVVNHTSDQHPYFKDALGNPASQYADYYTWYDAGHTTYRTFAGVQSMPQLNYDSPKVRQFAIDIALYWLDPLKNGDLSAGVDGFRCDVATGPPHAFWAQLRSAMTAKNPQALLLGEIWLSNPKDIATYLQGDQFDAAFDFPLYAALGGNTDKDGDGALAGRAPNLAALIVRAGQKLYPPAAHLVRFVNNHDTNRVASDVLKDPARERAAAVFELTAPGTPMIYYGEELGMLGDKGGPPSYDAYRREPLPWTEAMSGAGQTTWFVPPDRWNKPNSGVSVEAESGKPDSLLTLYQTLGLIRAKNPALSTGQYDLPNLSASESNLYELRDWNASELVVTVINFSDKPIDWTPTSEWSAGNQTYRTPTDPVLQQGTTNTSTTWTIQPGGYLLFISTP